MKENKIGYYQSLRWLDSEGAVELVQLIAKIELTEQELIQQITHGEADNSLAVYVDIGVSDGAIDSDRGFIAMTLGRKQRLVALDGRSLGGSPLRLFVYHQAEMRPDGRVFLPSQPKDKVICLEDADGEGKGLGIWFADTKSLSSRYTLYFFRSEVEAWAKGISGNPDTHELRDENQRLQQEVEALKTEVERLQAENLTAQDSPRKSALLLIARALELYQKGEPQRYTQTAYVIDILEGQSIHGLGDTTINNLLADAKKVIAEARNT